MSRWPESRCCFSSPSQGADRALRAGPEAEIATVRPRVVLIVATLAIERFWGRAALSDVVGRSRIEGERMLIPLPHPSGASRWLNEPANRQMLRRALGVV
jgi:uracil-DNA glycosylase